MTKINVVGLLVIGGLIGVLATVLLSKQEADQGVRSSSNAPTSFSSDADDDYSRRLLALENQLTEEIGRRNELENLIASLMESGPQAAPVETPERPVLQRLEALQDPAVREQRQSELRERFQQMNGTEARAARLEKSGFSPEQASWIVEREEEMRLENLYDEWDRRRQQSLQKTSDRQTVAEKMKAELGLDGYERYLQASGRPTSVAVGQIIDDSPAAKAGFKPGDQIVSYNGERVFNVNELNSSTVKGELGEPVVVGVIRDGQSMQIPMERGPLGVTTGINVRSPRVVGGTPGSRFNVEFETREDRQ